MAAVEALAAKAPYKIIGSGTYGAVIKPALPNEINGVPTEFPNNVTKVFYEKNDFNAALTSIRKVPEIMNALSGPNAGHVIHTYTKKYKGKNIPRNILRNLPAVNNNNNLQIIRMPRLGYDFAKSIKSPDIINSLREVPIPKILEQIVKLLQQTESLADHKYGHFDIRESNVMIQPSTGVMTIIDFDWLNEYKDIRFSYPFGYYNNPPECLLYKNWYAIFSRKPDGSYRFNYDPTIKDSVELFINIPKLQQYARQHFSSFSKYYTELGLDGSDIENHIYEQNAANINTFRQMFESGVSSADIFNYVLNTYDNFSLGLTLLNLLVALYPTIVQEADIDKIKETLRPIIQNGEEPYSDMQLGIVVKALKEITTVLMKLCSFRFDERYFPNVATTRAQTILADLVGGRAVGGGRRRRRRGTRRRKASN